MPNVAQSIEEIASLQANAVLVNAIQLQIPRCAIPVNVQESRRSASIANTRPLKLMRIEASL